MGVQLILVSDFLLSVGQLLPCFMDSSLADPVLKDSLCKVPLMSLPVLVSLLDDGLLMLLEGDVILPLLKAPRLTDIVVPGKHVCEETLPLMSQLQV